MIKRLFLIASIFMLIFSGKISAQDPQYSQFYANSLYLNPAFAGSAVCPRLSLNYRNQWPALGSTFVNYDVSLDGYFDFVQGGLGLHILSDQQGDGAITTTNIDAMYSYTLRVNRNFAIKGGFQVSYIQRKLDWGDLIFPDMIDELYGIVYRTKEVKPTDLSQNYFDYSAGFIGYGLNRNYYFGFAVHHLAQPEESFMKSSNAILPRKYTAHFGIEIPLLNRRFRRGELSLSPNIMYQRQQDFEQLNYGLYLSRKDIVFGTWLRQNFDFHYDAVILLIGFVQNKLKLAYSYDVTISKIAKETLGAHEISFSYQFPCFEKKQRWNIIPCPIF